MASEFLGKLDTIYFQIYNFTTDNPDKYLGLISAHPMLITSEKELAKYRKVLGQAPISKMPSTYRYFFD